MTDEQVIEWARKAGLDQLFPYWLDRLSALIARGAVEQAKKLESSIRAAMEADK